MSNEESNLKSITYFLGQILYFQKYLIVIMFGTILITMLIFLVAPFYRQENTATREYRAFIQHEAEKHTKSTHNQHRLSDHNYMLMLSYSLFHFSIKADRN